jgi:hypothetical protein
MKNDPRAQTPLIAQSYIILVPHVSSFAGGRMPMRRRISTNSVPRSRYLSSIDNAIIPKRTFCQHTPSFQAASWRLQSMCLLKGPCEAMDPDSYLTGFFFRLLAFPLLKFAPQFAGSSPPCPAILPTPPHTPLHTRQRCTRIFFPGSFSVCNHELCLFYSLEIMYRLL